MKLYLFFQSSNLFEEMMGWLTGWCCWWGFAGTAAEHFVRSSSRWNLHGQTSHTAGVSVGCEWPWYGRLLENHIIHNSWRITNGANKIYL